MTEHDILVGPGVVAAAVRCDPKTAGRLIDAEKFGKPIRTPGGHRRVLLSAVQAYLRSDADDSAVMAHVAAANCEAAESATTTAA